MAQRTMIQLIDDIDGGVAAETVTFALDGVSYEIDLSEDNAAALRDSFARWVGAGRKTGRAGSAGSGGGRQGRSSTSRTASGSGSGSERRRDLDVVRAWARENGHQVSDRGRVPGAVLEAYDAAH